MKVFAEHTIPLGMKYDKRIMDDIRERLAECLGYQLLKLKQTKEYIIPASIEEKYQGIEGKIAMTVHVPSVYCEYCRYYYKRDMQCKRTGLIFPKDGFCSIGEPLFSHWKDGEQK